MKKLCFFLALISLYIPGVSQTSVPYFGKIKWISGYAREISGENLNYTSAYPDYATTSLLTRCTNGSRVIEWETAPVPQKVQGEYVYFSWVAAHSSGTSSGVRYFDLYLNEEKLLTFATYPAHQRPDWIYTTPDSSALVFQQTKRDGANDAHGLAFLRLPLKRAQPGQPVKLKVVGTAQNSNDWYMTFKFAFEEKVDIEPVPFVLKDGSQTIAVTALHFGEDRDLQVKVRNKETHKLRVRHGINRFDVPVPAVQKEDSVFIYAAIGKQVYVNRFLPLKPVTHRVLHLIHHSHTDIGYSHLQPEVVRIHNKNIDDALRMIEATRNFPSEARFKWNIESLWALENWLKQAAPTQKERFVRAVKEGSIGLSALYANVLTGLSQPEEMFHYTDFAERLRREFGFTINSAMISDIPGYAWTTVTALARGGVKYFSSGPNFLGEQHPYGGDRVGHFVKTWGDKPVWWTSPSGEERVLLWTAGKGYSSWHGLAPGAIFDRGDRKIAAYLEELERNKYPYDMVQWRYNCVADNGPIDSTLSDFVHQWNQKYSSPKLVLNTTEKMFAELEQKYGDSLPVVKGDITPYWEDGAISTAAEEGINRRNSLRLQQLATLYAMLNPGGYDAGKFYNAWRNIILFHEHTWGAHNSISQPDVHFVIEQWRIKREFLLKGREEVDALERQLLQPLRHDPSKKIAVFNTLSWRRSGPVVLPVAGAGKSVMDEKGRKYPLQKLSDGSSTFWAHDVPPLGTAVYEIGGEEVAPGGKVVLTDSSIGNGLLALRWDIDNGSITHLQGTTPFNYAGAYKGQGLNGYWYVPGLDPAKAESNGRVQVRVVERGPVLTVVALESDAPGAHKLQRVIKLYAESGEVELENILDKKAVRSKEAVHFGFPFDASLDKTTLDAGYGSLSYIRDQLPGSNRDFLFGRRWIDVSGAGRGVQVKMLEAPMVEPEGMIDERLLINQSHKEWKKENKPTTTWFSYAMNNYWHTNYKADQEGGSRFCYALRPHDGFRPAEAERSGAEFTQPLMAVPLKADVVLPRKLLELTNSNLVVTAVEPQGAGNFLVRIYNPEPVAGQTAFVWGDLKPARIADKASGRDIAPGEKVSVAGMGLLEVILMTNDK